MLCRERDVEANDSFRLQFSPTCSAIQNVVWKFDDSACSLALSLSHKRTVVGRAESVVGREQVFFMLMDAAVLARTFPRSSVVVNCNQLRSEMRHATACFDDVTTRMPCFVLQDC